MRKVVVVIVVVLASWRAAGAQPVGAQAEVMFRQGKELLAAGQIAEACAAFDASQKLDPTVPTAMNQANCRERNGQLATAWGMFLEVVRQTRAATDKASQQMHAAAAERAAKLEPRLSTLRVDVPASNRIGGLEIQRDHQVLDPATWNKALPIDGGSYAISARAPGKATWSSTITVAAERDAKVIEIPVLRAAALVPPPTRLTVERPVVSEPPRERRATWTTARAVAVVSAAGAVAALATGTVLAVSAKRYQRDAHALCPDPRLACDGALRANELVRSGHRRAIGANVAFGLGGAAAVGAAVLWLVGAPESRAAIAIAPGQLGITAGGRF